MIWNVQLYYFKVLLKMRSAGIIVTLSGFGIGVAGKILSDSVSKNAEGWDVLGGAAVMITAGAAAIAIYGPWQDKWQNAKSDGLKLLLPDFKRSLVIRIRL